MNASVRSVRDLIERVRAEYLEMPGLAGGESIQTRRARADLDATTRPRKAS